MRFNSIELVDCTPIHEPSEGLLLLEYFRMVKLERERLRVGYHQSRRKKEFIDLLKRLDTDILHISAHGYYDDGQSSNNNRCIAIGNSYLYPRDIPKRVGAKIVVLNACVSSHRSLASAFYNAGVRRFLAPKQIIDWASAALFAELFYGRLVRKRNSFAASFRYAGNRLNLKGLYPEWWGDE